MEETNLSKNLLKYKLKKIESNDYNRWEMKHVYLFKMKALYEYVNKYVLNIKTKTCESLTWILRRY